jgi:hypothetical protein
MTTPAQRVPQFLPSDLREELTRGLPMDLDEDLRWWIERFVENVYVRGYSAGYLDGWPAGGAHEERRQARNYGGRTALDNPLSGPATVQHREIDIPDAPP